MNKNREFKHFKGVFSAKKNLKYYLKHKLFANSRFDFRDDKKNLF